MFFFSKYSFAVERSRTLLVYSIFFFFLARLCRRSTSIITVPFICLPLRCQVHPDLSSLRCRLPRLWAGQPASSRTRFYVSPILFLHGHLSACCWPTDYAEMLPAGLDAHAFGAGHVLGSIGRGQSCCTTTAVVYTYGRWRLVVRECVPSQRARDMSWPIRKTTGQRSGLPESLIFLPSGPFLNPALYLTAHLNSDALRC